MKIYNDDTELLDMLLDGSADTSQAEEKDIVTVLDSAEVIDSLANCYFPDSNSTLARASISKAFEFLPTEVSYSNYNEEEFDTDLFKPLYTDERGYTLYSIGLDVDTNEELLLLKNEASEALLFSYTVNNKSTSLESAATEGPLNWIKQKATQAFTKSGRASTLDEGKAKLILDGAPSKPPTVEQVISSVLLLNTKAFLLYEEAVTNVNRNDKLRVAVVLDPTDPNYSGLRKNILKTKEVEEELENIGDKDKNTKLEIKLLNNTLTSLQQEYTNLIVGAIKTTKAKLKAKVTEIAKTNGSGIDAEKFKFVSYTTSDIQAKKWSETTAKQARSTLAGAPDYVEGEQVYTALDKEYALKHRNDRSKHIIEHLPKELKSYVNAISNALIKSGGLTPYSTGTYAKLLKLAQEIKAGKVEGAKDIEAQLNGVLALTRRVRETKSLTTEKKNSIVDALLKKELLDPKTGKKLTTAELADYTDEKLVEYAGLFGIKG